MWRILAIIQRGLIMLSQSLCGTDCSSIRKAEVAPDRVRL